MLNVIASELPRLIPCNGSRLLGASEAPGTASSVKAEADAAAWAAKAVFRGDFDLEELTDRRAPNGHFITEAIAEHVAIYINAISNSTATFNQTDVAVAFSGAGWTVAAVSDHIALTGTTLYVDKFVYGFRIVEPDDHWQMIAEAIGWIAQNPTVTVETIVLIVHQPRAMHPYGPVREWPITRQDLMNRYSMIDNTLRNLGDKLRTGPQCTHCPKIAACPAARKASMNAIDVTETSFDDRMSDDDLARELDTLDRAATAIKARQKAVEELACHRVTGGAVVAANGHRYVMKRSYGQRKWNDGMTPGVIQVLTGVDVSKPGMVSPAEAKRRGIDDEVLKTLATAPETGAKLTRVDVNKEAKRQFEGK